MPVSGGRKRQPWLIMWVAVILFVLLMWATRTRPPAAPVTTPASNPASTSPPPDRAAAAPASEFRVKYESPGLTYGPGYDYPSTLAGRIVCGETTVARLAYPIARWRQDIDWILVQAAGCARPVWTSQSDVYSDHLALAQLPALDVPPSTLVLPPGLEASARYRGVVDHDAMSTPQQAAPFKAARANDTLEGYADPYTGRRVCAIKEGTAVSAVAYHDAQPYMVLVAAPSCPEPVWVDPSDIRWAGFQWPDDQALYDKLPHVRARVQRPLPALPVAPESPLVRAALPAQHRTVFVRSEDGQAHPWHSEMPDEWRAPSAQTADLLVTVRRTPVFVHRCAYYSGNILLVRERVVARLTLNDGRHLVATRTFDGESPRADRCPASTGIAAHAILAGDPPSAAVFVSWLRPFMTGSAR